MIVSLLPLLYTLTMPLNILSLNVNGLNHPAKRHSLWRTAKALHSDILCIQETHLTMSDSSLCKNHQFPTIYQACHSTKSRGVLIAIKDTVDFQLSKILIYPEGRYLIVVGTINKVSYTLINIYAPNTHQMKFLHRVVRLAKPIKKGHLILCGDFNIAPDNNMDTTSPAKRRISPLKNFLSSQDLFDVWRCHHGSEKNFTHFSPRHNSYSRIDLFATDKWLLQNVCQSAIHATTWSDHAPISISITDPSPRFSGVQTIIYCKM